MRASSNARWIGLSQAARVVLQLASMSVLARLLSPDSFGLMAMATVVTNLAGMLRDLGTGAAIIQREDLTEETTSAVFWFNVAVGSAVAVILAAFAPVIAIGFRSPELPPLLWALAPTFPIMSSTTAHQALLERRSAFPTLARIEVISSAGALAVAVAAALLGAGAFSLALQAITLAVLSTAQLWVASRWRPAAGFRWSALRSLARFSGNLAGFNFVNYLSRNADSILIGRSLGATALGTYSLAYRVMLFPLQNLTFVANRALLPVMSRQQDNVADMAALYLRTVRVVATLTAPMMVGLFAVRAPFVQLLFGSPWALVADVLAWLAPVGFLQSIVSTTGTVFTARGRTDLLLRLGVLGAVLQVAAFVAGTQYGVVEVATFYCAATLLNASVCLTTVMRQLATPPLRLLEAIASPAASALSMALCIAAVDRFASVPEPYWQLELGLHVLVGAVSYCATLFIVFRQSPRDLLLLLRGRPATA